MRVRQPPRSLNLPPQSEVQDELLRQLNARSRPVAPRDLYEPIADHFNLSTLQRHAGPPNDPYWHYRVRQARRRLGDEGLIDKSRRDFWSLTAAGRKRAEWISKRGKPQTISESLWDDDPGGRRAR